MGLLPVARLAGAEAKARYLAAKLSPVAPPQPEANQMPAFFGLVEVHVGSAAMHNDAVVQDLNLATLHPKVVTVARIAQEPIEQAHRLGPLIVQDSPRLFIPAPDRRMLKRMRKLPPSLAKIGYQFWTSGA